MTEASLKVSARNEEAWEALKPTVLYLFKPLKYAILFETTSSFLLSMSADDAELAHTVLTFHKLPLVLTLDVVYPI